MANREFSFSLGAGVSASSAITDPEVAAELFKLYNAVNTVALTLDLYTNGLETSEADRPFVSNAVINKEAKLSRVYLVANVDLVKGTLVYVRGDGKVDKALNTPQNLLTKFIVMSDTLAGAYAPLARRGVIDGFVGLTPGNMAYTSTVAGGILFGATPGAGVQYIGFVISPTSIYFDPDLYIS